MNEGMNVTEACDVVEIARSTNYFTSKREEEAITEFLDIINAINIDNLLMILNARNILLKKIIEDGLAETTKTKERLAIH